MQLISQSVHRWFDRVVAFLITFFYRLFFTITQMVNDSRFLLHAIGKVRRLWLVHFRKEYVQRQLFLRHGDCQQCGVCCNLLFTCPMLTKSGGCFVYGSCRPKTCKVFPIDQRDINEVNLCGGHCGYSFDGKGVYRISNTKGA